MKKALTYSAIVLLLGFTACNKNDNIELGSGNISFAPASVGTRALIEDEAGLQAQTFQVYDLMGTTKYIDNTIVYSATDEAWVYGTEATYKWADGTHKFFGYTNGAGDFASNALSVAKTLTTAEADQVDLLYSKVFTTTAAEWKASKTTKDPVMLDFKHLFSAVSFMVTNATTNQVVLNSVDVKIPNKGSATVDFSGDETAVTYGTVSQDGDFITATALSDVTVAQNQLIDVLTQATVTDTLYQMVWPQEFAEGSELTVHVVYTMTSPAANEGDDPVVQHFEKDVKIPAVTWAAGQKYVYMLKVYPTDVRLVFEVQPWDEGEAGDLDTESGSINMSNVTWMNSKVIVGGEEVNTLDNSGYSVTMYYQPTVNGEPYTINNGYFPAQGYFTVNYPLSGLFKIDLIPAYGQTEADLKKDMYEIYIYDYPTPASGDTPATPGSFRPINPDGEPISSNTVYFQVHASENVAATHPEYRAQIDIWFKPDGSDDWISAYSEIRANYALIIPAR